MGNFTFLRDENNQVVLKASSLAATASSSANTSTLPASNAVTLPLSLPWRSSSLVTQHLDIDFGTAVSVSLFAVCAHNISSAATEFKFVGGGTYPPAADTISLLGKHQGPGTTWAQRTAGALSHQYWRLTITDAGNEDGYYEVGYVVLGVESELGFNMDFDWIESWMFSNRKAETEAGSPLVGELVDRRSRLALTFSNLTKAERDTFKTFVRGFEGARRPAFIIPDPDDNMGFFGRLETPLQIDLTHRNKGVMGEGAVLGFVEDNPGIKVRV